MTSVPNIDPAGRVPEPNRNAESSRKSHDASEFRATLQDFMKDVNKMQSEADQSLENIQKAIHNVDQAKDAMEEAKNAYTTMMEFRDKIMKTYEDIARMRQE